MKRAAFASVRLSPVGLSPVRLSPVRLGGGAHARGLAQARGPDAGTDPGSVKAAIAARLEAVRPLLAASDAQAYLDRQWRFAEAQCAPQMAELAGVAEGFGAPARDLFALMHLGVLSRRFEVDGCSAFAARSAEGPILAKNRDLSGPHALNQQVFLHEDVDHAGPAGCGLSLVVGTLGVPGAYSSGVNAAGLALADTAVAAPRHGVGWLRYFAMTRLLASCRTTPEALAMIAGMRHAGGGCLLIADRAGSLAAVELLAGEARIETGGPLARSNHFTSLPEDEALSGLAAAERESTLGRLAALRAALAPGLGGAALARASEVMGDRGGGGRAALFRSGEGEAARTISIALYEPGRAALTICRGDPRLAAWENFSLDEMVEARAP